MREKDNGRGSWGETYGKDECWRKNLEGSTKKKAQDSERKKPIARKPPRILGELQLRGAVRTPEDLKGSAENRQQLRRKMRPGGCKNEKERRKPGGDKQLSSEKREGHVLSFKKDNKGENPRGASAKEKENRKTTEDMKCSFKQRPGRGNDVTESNGRQRIEGKPKEFVTTQGERRGAMS